MRWALYFSFLSKSLADLLWWANEERRTTCWSMVTRRGWFSDFLVHFSFVLLICLLYVRVILANEVHHSLFHFIILHSFRYIEYIFNLSLVNEHVNQHLHLAALSLPPNRQLLLRGAPFASLFPHLRQSQLLHGLKGSQSLLLAQPRRANLRPKVLLCRQFALLRKND